MLSHSPYVPPQADLEVEGELVSAGTGSFDIQRCMQESWDATAAYFPLWLWVGIVGVVTMTASLITVIGAFLLVPVLFWGLTAFALTMHDRRARFGDLFSGFSCYGRALGSMLAYLVVSTLSSLPTEVLLWLAQSSGNSLIAGSMAVLHYSLVVVLSVRLSFAPLLIVDRNVGGFRALSESWHLTGPVQWKLIGLLLIAGITCGAGLLALVIGIIPAAVMAYQMTVSAYRQVVGGPLRA